MNSLKTFVISPMMRLLLFMVPLSMSCIEEIDLEPTSGAVDQKIKNALVVDARIDDSGNEQCVYLSRIGPLGSNVTNPEENAKVTLLENTGLRFSFNEKTPGNYCFSSRLLLDGTQSYQLEIITEDGLTFRSNKEQLPAKVEIQGINIRRETSGQGKEGLSIMVSNIVADGDKPFFRFEYEETYKIIAPDHNPFEWDEVDYDFFMNDDDGWEVSIKPREEEARVCYATNSSKDLNLASPMAIVSGTVKDHEVRFIGRNNHIIAHRYSILVKQYHQSLGAHSFFSDLDAISSAESVFSNIQPGFPQGNITSVDNDNRVLGYFDLCSYSEKRVFINHDDFFPSEPIPAYPLNCNPVVKPSLYPVGFHATEIDGALVLDGVSESPLIEGILNNRYAYLATNENFMETDAFGEIDRAPYFVKLTGCVDCRVLGSNVPPEFWVED